MVTNPGLAKSEPEEPIDYGGYRHDYHHSLRMLAESGLPRPQNIGSEQRSDSDESDRSGRGRSASYSPNHGSTDSGVEADISGQKRPRDDHFHQRSVIGGYGPNRSNVVIVNGRRQRCPSPVFVGAVSHGGQTGSDPGVPLPSSASSTVSSASSRSTSSTNVSEVSPPPPQAVGQVVVGVKAPDKRNPKCSKCKNHGKNIDVKGHKRYCQHKNCRCKKCILTDKRKEIMAQQVSLRRRQANEEIYGPVPDEDEDGDDVDIDSEDEDSLSALLLSKLNRKNRKLQSIEQLKLATEVMKCLARGGYSLKHALLSNIIADLQVGLPIRHIVRAYQAAIPQIEELGKKADQMGDEDESVTNCEATAVSPPLAPESPPKSPPVALLPTKAAPLHHHPHHQHHQFQNGGRSGAEPTSLVLSAPPEVSPSAFDRRLIPDYQWMPFTIFERLQPNPLPLRSPYGHLHPPLHPADLYERSKAMTAMGPLMPPFAAAGLQQPLPPSMSNGVDMPLDCSNNPKENGSATNGNGHKYSDFKN